MQGKYHKFKCEPSTKLYYSKYHTCIELKPIKSSVGRPNIPDRFQDDYRIVVSNYGSLGYQYTKIYTSSDSLIDYIMDDIFLSINIKKITAPVNEQHIKHLHDKDVNTVFRDKYWYSKYQYRIETTPRRDVDIPEHEINDFKKVIFEDFRDDCRLKRNYQPWTFWQFNAISRGHVPGAPWGMSPPITKTQQSWWPPTIFTNDEANVFLLKMRFYHLYEFKITNIILLEEILKG